MGISQASRRGRRPVCPAERSSASGTYHPAKGVGIGRKTDMTICKLQAALSKPAAAELAPGPAQTRASPPHQAKNGLDGDPGVWAYACIAKLLRDSEMRGVCRQRGLCYLR